MGLCDGARDLRLCIVQMEGNCEKNLCKKCSDTCTRLRGCMGIKQNLRSASTNVESLNVDGEVITENSDIAKSMNEFFCSVGRDLSVKIPQQPTPLLSQNKH